MRQVTVFSTFTNESKTINSSATTWGALKSELTDAGIEHNNMKAMVRSTKATLEMEGALLPEEDFVLFLTPSKVKAGWRK